MTAAVFPGSFDPITIGHLDVIERAAAMFDKVIVCIMVNGDKRPFFPMERRLEFLRASISHIPNAQAALCTGLLAGFAREQDARVLVKGVRGCTDFDWEFQLAQINRDLWPELDTVLLPARTQHLHISSTMVREMIRYRQRLDDYVPAGALGAITRAAEERQDIYGK